jgi:hypothetical protein
MVAVVSRGMASRRFSSTRCGGGDGDIGLGVQGVTDPAKTEVVDGKDIAGSEDGVPGSPDERGIDSIQQARADLDDGGAEHSEDGDGDEQPDDRVGPRQPDGDAGGAEDDGQRGEAVGSGVEPVGHEGCGADLVPDADAVTRDELVPGEPDEAGDGDGPQVGDGFGMEEATESPGSRRRRWTGRSWRRRRARRGPRRDHSRT